MYDRHKACPIIAGIQEVMSEAEMSDSDSGYIILV